MSNEIAIQIHCPHCNGTNAARPDGNFTCEFCLTPFTIVQAQREESRILEEIKGWVDKRIGEVRPATGMTDATTRTYLFKQRVYPDLRRDVDRSLEVLGNYGQFVLVPLPIPLPQRGAAGLNPLVSKRREILELKNLRARLLSEQITSFAVGLQEQAHIQALDRRLAEIIHLSHVADAASRRDASGYAAARRNLEVLLDEVGQSLGVEATADSGFAAYLTGIQRRYRALCEVCRIGEELASPNAVSGAALGDRLLGQASELRGAAQELERSGYSPADSLPIVIGMNEEARALDTLSRWLRAYDSLAAKTLQPFSSFVSELNGVFGGEKLGGEALADLVEGCAWLVRVARGEQAVGVFADHGWAEGWAEGARTKKTLGLFGVEERLASLAKLFLPVWVAEVSFSKSTGTVFKEGVEQKCTAVVDATAPSAPKVKFLLDGAMPLVREIGRPRSFATRQVALLASTGAAAAGAIQQAAKAQPGMLNAQVRLRGTALLPAAVAVYESKNGSRQLAACSGGLIPVDPSLGAASQAADRVLRLFV